jgi:hypothetical protein
MTASRILPFYSPTWAGVCRSAAWCLVFLWLFGKLVPPLPEEPPLHELTDSTNVIPMLTIFDDHRTVREDYVADKRKRHIAWLSDSSATIIPPDQVIESADTRDMRLVPKMVSETLQKKYGLHDFDVPLYLRLGMRPVDNLVFALQALKEKPDFIVMSVNHIWTFSHYQIANKTSSFNLAPSLWAHRPDLWPMILMFCSPSQNLWALAGDRFDIIREASPFKNHLEKKYGGDIPSPIALGVPKTNVHFWVVMNVLHGNEGPVATADGKIKVNAMYREVINDNAPYDDASLAAGSFRRTVDILKESGIPVLIYAHPVSDYFYGFPETAKKIHETEDFLSKMGQELAGTNVRIISQVPEDVRKSIVFRKNDDFHADAPGKLNAFLAKEIWSMMKSEKNRKTAP